MDYRNARASTGSRRASLNVMIAGALLLAGAGITAFAQRAHSAQADVPEQAPIAPQAVIPATAPQAFKDVPANHWASQAVNQLAARGIIQGNAAKPGKIPTTEYDGNRFTTRYEAAVLLDRFAKAMEQGRQPLHLQKQSSVPNLPASWAHNAQADLVASNFIPVNSPLLQGTGNTPVTAVGVLRRALAQVAVRTCPTAAMPPDGQRRRLRR